MYMGSYFKACLQWAINFADSEDHVFIISAKYGFLRLNDLIDPYDLKMGQVGSVSLDTLKKQAQLLKIEHCSVVNLAGKEYLKKIKKVFNKVDDPFEGLRMGLKLSAIKRDLNEK